MAKPKAAPAPAPVIDDEDEPDCPRCPPVGAPAWMATFADMATLLMAFFVLILSFANFDEVSFKKMTGALREHFGVQLIEIMPNPESTTPLPMDSPPASNPPSPQDTQDSEKSPAPQPEAPPQTPEQAAMVKALTEALEQAGASLTVQDGKVMLQLPDGDGALAQAVQDAVPDLPQSEPKTETASETIASAAPAPTQTGTETAQGSTPQDQAAAGEAGSNAQRRAAIAEARLNVALRELEGQGLVDVQREQEKVIVTVGAGGAFNSGSADLTEAARGIMERIALASAGDRGEITVTGHTDGVPLSGGPFTDNWGLAAARASSVVRELGASGMIAPTRLTAVSRGDSVPLADNATEDGRAENRRIEIEIDFGTPRRQD